MFINQLLVCTSDLNRLPEAIKTFTPLSSNRIQHPTKYGTDLNIQLTAFLEESRSQWKRCIHRHNSYLGTDKNITEVLFYVEALNIPYELHTYRPERNMTVSFYFNPLAYPSRSSTEEQGYIDFSDGIGFIANTIEDYSLLESLKKLKESKVEMTVPVTQEFILNLNDLISVVEFIATNHDIQFESIEDFLTEWDTYGMRWREFEAVHYMSEGGEKVTIDTVLSYYKFTRLPSGQIISWDY